MTVKDRSGHAAGLKRPPLLSFYFFCPEEEKVCYYKDSGRRPFPAEKRFLPEI